MNNRDYYEQQLPVLKAIPGEKIKKPNHIPVGVLVQEASDLYHWCQDDQQALTAHGLDRTLVPALQARMGALIEAEAQWQSQQFSRGEKEKTWGQKAPEVIRLRNEKGTGDE